MAEQRPRCACHDEPMDGSVVENGRQRWQCPAARRARQAAYYRRNKAARNYARTRTALRARIARKRELIEQLEEALA